MDVQTGHVVADIETVPPAQITAALRIHAAAEQRHLAVHRARDPDEGMVLLLTEAADLLDTLSALLADTARDDRLRGVITQAHGATLSRVDAIAMRSRESEQITGDDRLRLATIYNVLAVLAGTGDEGR